MLRFVMFLALIMSAMTTTHSYTGNLAMTAQAALTIGTRIRIGAQRTLLKGGPGSGKTHLLSEFERSFFIPVESGTTGFSTAYACHFFQVEEGVPAIPRTFAAFLEMLKRFVESNALKEGETQRPYAHLMIDSVSAIEDLIHVEVCRRHGASSMEDAEYGPKLYYATVPLWRQFLAAIDGVVNGSGANVWLTGHTEEAAAANQSGETYRKTTLRIKGTGKAQDDIRSIITQSMDNDWLLAQQITVKRGGRGQRTVAIAGGRTILTQPGDTPGGGSYEAKSRIRVPERIPATQEDIRAAMKAGVTRPPKRILLEIEALLKRLPNEQRAIIEADLKKGDNAGWLDRTLARAKALLVAIEADQVEDAPDEPETKPEATTPAVEPSAEKKEPASTPATPATPVPTSLPVPAGNISEAMRELLTKLHIATTAKDIGAIATETAMDGRFTPDERKAANAHIQARRQELK